MSKRPYFPLYANDWLSSTKIAVMTPEQEGGYIRLLAHAWNSEDCGLPDDDDELASLSRLGQGWFNGGSTKVRKCFTKMGDRLFNERLLLERKKWDDWSRKSKEGGMKSAKMRKQSQNNEVNHRSRGGSTTVPTKGQPKGNLSLSLSSSNRKKEKKYNKENFVKPNIEEIKVYCLKRKNSVNAQKFFDYYESKGWLVGKSPMKDWMAAIRTWEQNNLSPTVAPRFSLDRYT